MTHENNAARVREYITGHGAPCFVCRAPYEISGGFVEIDNGRALQRVTCDACGASWRDIYTLTGVDEFKEGEPNESI